MKSIGTKIYVALVVIAILFVTTIVLNIQGLNTIGDYNYDLGNHYLGLGTA